MSGIRCETCTHALNAHQNAKTGKVALCRITGCGCTAFVEPKPEPVEESGPRRVCIDVPDGYVLSMSLIPHQPYEEEEGS
jgi:hypothetical protein